MILNVYYDKGSPDMNKLDDVLDIIYKDMDTGKKYVETIIGPQFEIWITKPEYRNYKHIKNWIKKECCDRYIVPYKTRFKEAAKILGETIEAVKYSPYLFQADMEIEHFYLMQFALEYGNTLPKKLSCGFLDIECDLINIPVTRPPEYGEAPINLVSYMDAERKQMYTFVNTTNNVPIVPEDHPRYEYYKDLRERFDKQMEILMSELGNLQKTLHDMFDELYGSDIEYHILVFDDEIKMLQALFKVIEASDNDYVLIWNAPFDMQHLIERPRTLGLDPNALIVSPEFGNDTELTDNNKTQSVGRVVYYKEDKNHIVHKRKHICNTYTRYTVVDQMVHYSGIRSARGKLPSVKLNAIARTELKDEKFDFSEYGNIRMFPYLDFVKFLIYNIKDVLLQYGIERKTKDMMSVYTTISNDCVLPREVFTSTLVVGNSLRKFAYTRDFVLGSNRNKLYKNIDEAFVLEEEFDLVDDDYDDGEEFEEESEESNDSQDEKKRDKYAGAIVMAPQHMSESGYRLLGKLSKYIHVHVIDMDIGSEYPSAMLIMNSCNETMVGKVFLLEPGKINIKFYENMYFVDKKDEVGYEKTKDPSNLLVEYLSQSDPLDFGHVIFGLPEPTEILDYIGDNIDDFVKD